MQKNKPKLALLLLSASLLLTGCAPAIPQSPEEHAARVYAQMHSLYSAATNYKKEHGTLPAGPPNQIAERLVADGYLKSYPRPDPAIFGRQPIRPYQIIPNYDEMDAWTTPDPVIYLPGLKDEICRAFNNRYSSNQSGPTIYDFEANNNKYPGTIIGRHMLLYAIKWKSEDVDNCEIEWVIEYNKD